MCQTTLTVCFPSPIFYSRGNLNVSLDVELTGGTSAMWVSTLLAHTGFFFFVLSLSLLMTNLRYSYQFT